MDDTLLLEIAHYQAWTFPLKTPLVLDSKGVEDWAKFQLYLKCIGIINQNGLCFCNEPIGEVDDLHHALISRREVMGIDNPNLIHSSYNVLVLHRNCHFNMTRQRSMKILVKIFGYKPILDWYYSQEKYFKLGLKALPYEPS